MAKKATSKKRKGNDKKIGVIVAIIIVALIAVIGASYAFFTYQETSEKTNTVEVGTLVLDLADTTNGVSILNAVPVTKTYALANYDRYNFTLTNSGTVAASYKLTLDPQALAAEEKQLGNQYIRYQLRYATNKTIATAEESEITTQEGTLSSLTDNILLTETIAAKDTTDTVVYYELLLWVDKDATKEQVAGTKYVAKLSVDAIQTYGTKGGVDGNEYNVD